MLKLIRVRGSSLAPLLTDGDFVLILTWRWLHAPFKVGDMIVFQEAMHGRLIKQIHAISGDGTLLTVRGTNDFSTDSRLFGDISPQQIIGKVIYHIHQKQKAAE